MAETVIDVIKRALLYTGAISMRATPKADEADICLSELQSLLPSLPGWTDWNEIEVQGDFEIKGDDYRIAVIGDVEVEIIMPQLVIKRVTIDYDGAGAPVQCGTFYVAPRDGSRILVYAQTTGNQSFYAYRADNGQWVDARMPALSSIVPVNVDMHNHLAALLAERIAPIYGTPLDGALASNINRARLAWAARYDRFVRVNTPANRFEDVGQYM